jgi:hypothetical protein
VKEKYWSGAVPTMDDFDSPINGEFIDGKTSRGPWAFMSPSSWRTFGLGTLGTGYGQRYRKQPDGRWLKVEG